ncbi:MAG TPA: heterodisulfide reductase-related iron-sulfur binding cluster [Myxococcaceae bacterium]|nr:heterodisulfide reductase-related iron-sulfur binding cluster [Myxococcaceae bacterium]
MPDKELIDTCVHCGFCLPACPTYQSWGEEMDSPRGRIYLMKQVAEGALPLDRGVVRHIDACLGCMGCVTACPSGVKYDALIEQMRAEIENRYPRRWSDRIFRESIFALFPYPLRLKIAVLLQLIYVKTGLRWVFHALGLHRLLPRRTAQMESLMPKVSARLLTSSLPPFSPARGERRARVALIAGCVQRVYFPEVNDATIRVLNAEGCDVLVPRGQGCCGALSLHSGRAREAQSFAKDIVARFERENVDAVLVNAAGCGSNLKEYGRLFAGDPQWSERGTRFAAKVKDVSEFLVSLGARAQRHPMSLKIACHDACHLAHAQRIRSQPRELLRSIPGVELCDVPDGDQCCGSAGIYNLLQPKSAREIGARKVENVLSTHAQLLASTNPGCTLQIQMMLRERGAHLVAAHPIELLDASIRNDSAAFPTKA